MIFIIHDPEIHGVWKYGFRAVEGLQPIKLPSSVGVMDFFAVRKPNIRDPLRPDEEHRLTEITGSPSYEDIKDTTSFSIVFSPTGKLVVRGVNFAVPPNELFESDQPSGSLPPEPSRNSFVIYDAGKFKKLYGSGALFTGYLTELRDRKIFINPYTGTMISTD